MPVAQGRQRSYKKRSRSRKSSREITAGQKKFLRRLINNLESLIDEKGHYSGDDPETADLEEEGDKDEDEVETEVSKERTVGTNAPRTSKNPGIKQDRKYEPKNIARLKTLLELHGQLSFQIQSSLNALGGGGRTANALARMQQDLDKTSKSFNHEFNAPGFYPNTCVENLYGCQDGVREVIKAFKELGVFNARFFDKLDAVYVMLGRTAFRVDCEYGSSRSDAYCKVDEYPDSLFGSLVRSLEAYMEALTKMAEKEIPTIQQTQNFLSQRYLLLTTVATFLSSVTATTLQITAVAPASTISTVINTLWSVSLVFSTASAVYSLLLMTWRQSSIRQPAESLPSVVYVWVRNGPMYALITSLVSFSIGLCLLAFLVADQQGGLALAVVPTAFAGLNAYAIFVLVTWFRFEQWKVRNAESWRKMRDKFVIPATKGATKVMNKIKGYGLGANRKVEDFGKYLSNKMRTTPVSARSLCERTHNDVEPGRQASGPFSQFCTLSSENDGQLPFEVMDETIEAAEPLRELAVGEAMFALEQPSSRSTHDSEDPFAVNDSHFENLLQFSPDCNHLAWAFLDTVTIYDACMNFRVLTSLKVSDAVKQLSWNPDTSLKWEGYPHAMHLPDLLVRSSEGFSVWELQVDYQSDVQGVCHVKEVGRLHLIVSSPRWIQEEDAGSKSFSCLSDKSLKVFERTCKELDSYDLSWMRNVIRTLDVSFLSTDKIMCLADMANDGMCERQFLVVDKAKRVVEWTYCLDPDHVFHSIFQASSIVWIYGGNVIVEIVDILDGADGTRTEYQPSWVLGEHPPRAVVFIGPSGKMIARVTKEEISILSHSLTEGTFTDHIHVITTPTSRAIARNPVSFAAGVNNGRSFPYMFAFGDEDGSVRIWSLFSNSILDYCQSAEEFEVHDQRDHLKKTITVTKGKFLILPPPVERGWSGFVHEYICRRFHHHLCARRAMLKFEGDHDQRSLLCFKYRKIVDHCQRQQYSP